MTSITVFILEFGIIATSKRSNEREILMKISTQELVKMGACPSGLKRFIKQVNGSDEEVEVLSLIGGENTTSDLLWGAGETLSKDKIVAFACDLALINIDKIKPYTDDFELIVEALKSRVFTSAAVAAVDYAVDYAAAFDAVAAIAAVDAVDYAVDYAAVDYAIAAAAVDYAIAAFDAFDAIAAVAAVDFPSVASVDEVNKLLIKLFSK